MNTGFFIHSKIFNRRKIYLFGCLIIFLISCEKEDSILNNSELVIVKQTRTEKISFQQLPPEIQNYVETNRSQRTFSKGLSVHLGNILKDSVVMTTDSLNNKKISFNVSHKEKNQLYFDNYIISSNQKGNLSSYFVRYIPNKEWWYKHLDFSNFSEFTGKVEYYNIKGTKYKQALIEAGRGEIEIYSQTKDQNLQEITIITYREEPCTHPEHQDDHAASGTCSHPTITSQISTYYVGTPSTGGGGSGTYDPNLHGGGGGGSIEPIITATTTEIKALLASELEYVLELSSDQYNEIKYLPIPQLQEALTFVNENGLSQEAKDFTLNAITAWQYGGEVDFEEQVILDESFTDNECLNGVYEAMGKAPTFDNYLKNFDSEMSVANLKLTTGIHPSYPDATAVTDPPQNYLIQIMFNTNKLSRPLLDVARTFIHEMIHAEMYRLLLSKAQAQEIPWSKQFIESMENDYPGLYDYYMRYYYDMPNGVPLGDPKHEMMAQHYRTIIENALREYDSSFPNDVYEALAWRGSNRR